MSKPAALIYLDAAIRRERDAAKVRAFFTDVARENAQDELDACIIEDLTADERETLTSQLRFEARWLDGGEAKTAEAARALSLAGLVDVDEDGINIRLTTRGARIARALAS